MVLENLWNETLTRKKPLVSFVYGFFAVLLSFLLTLLFSKLFTYTQVMFFSTFLVFLIILMLLPFFMRFLEIEVIQERSSGGRNFFYYHKDIFSVFIFSFLGIHLYTDLSILQLDHILFHRQ